MIEIAATLSRKRFKLDAHVALTHRVTALFGPSGAGKSTLLNVIAGIAHPDSGRIVIDGVALFDAQQKIDIPVHQRQIGLVFQDHRLFPHLSVEKNLRYGAHRFESAAQQKGLEEITALLELGSLLRQKPYQLSGGEKQRVALGRALMSKPRLLMLDEPLASLDKRLKSQILPYLKRVAEEVEIPMIYVSHSMDEITQLTDHVMHIAHGKVHAAI
jgi:molybdate transport system ATP-binding protein